MNEDIVKFNFEIHESVGYKGLGVSAFAGVTYNNDTTIHSSKTLYEGGSLLKVFLDAATKVTNFVKSLE